MPDNQPSRLSKRWSKIRRGFWSYWIDLMEVLWRMLIRPMRSPGFVFYFLAIIVIVGGLGVSIAIFEGIKTGTLRTTTAVPRSLSTYLLAMLSTAFVDLNFNLEAREKRSLRMFVQFALVLGVVGGTIALLTSNIHWAYGCALIGTFLAFFLWWLANSENEKLIEPDPTPRASLGENVEQQLPGTLKGIQS